MFSKISQNHTEIAYIISLSVEFQINNRQDIQIKSDPLKCEMGMGKIRVNETG